MIEFQNLGEEEEGDSSIKYVLPSRTIPNALHLLS